jgi:hypothetical protein
MKRDAAKAITICFASIMAAVVTSPVAIADPAPQPKAGASCQLADPDSQTFAEPRSGSAEPKVLLCTGNQGRTWQPIDGLQRPVHKFYTYGPTAILYPPDLNLGELWDGVGATTSDICVESQSFADGRPQETGSNNTGQYFGFTLSPDMTILTLKGNCRWQISPCSGHTGPSPCTAAYRSPAIDQRVRDA